MLSFTAIYWHSHEFVEFRNSKRKSSMALLWILCKGHDSRVQKWHLQPQAITHENINEGWFCRLSRSRDITRKKTSEGQSDPEKGDVYAIISFLALHGENCFRGIWIFEAFILKSIKVNYTILCAYHPYTRSG